MKRRARFILPTSYFIPRTSAAVHRHRVGTGFLVVRCVLGRPGDGGWASGQGGGRIARQARHRTVVRGRGGAELAGREAAGASAASYRGRWGTGHHGQFVVRHRDGEGAVGTVGRIVKSAPDDCADTRWEHRSAGQTAEQADASARTIV